MYKKEKETKNDPLKEWFEKIEEKMHGKCRW